MLSFARFLIESDTIDYAHYNLQHKFEYYNRVLFDDQIPPCPVIWDDHPGLKKAAGITNFKYNTHTKELIPGSLSIHLCTRFKRTEQNLDATLIHEMIHAYLAANRQPEAGHNIFFTSKAHECSRKVGFPISLTDDISGLELRTDITSTKTVVMVQHAGTYYAVFLSGNTYDTPTKLNELEAEIGRASHLSNGDVVIVLKSNTNLDQKYGNARNIKKFKGITPAEYESLLQHGQVLRRIVHGQVDQEFINTNLAAKEAVVVLTRRKNRPDNFEATFYTASVAKDPLKLHQLIAKKEDYFDGSNPAEWDVKIFTTISSLITLKKWKINRDPRVGGYYPATPVDATELLKGAHILWTFGG